MSDVDPAQTADSIVLVIDDHQTTGEGVGLALMKAGVASQYEWFASFAAARKELHRFPPCVVVLDLRLPDPMGPDQMIPILAESKHEVVVFTSGDNPFLIRQAIKGGALSVVRKSAPTQDLIDAVKAAQCGEVRANLDWASALDQDDDFVSNYLSKVEARVLAAYAAGKSATQVAHAEGIKENTVNTYISRIRTRYREVGRPADSRVDLYRRAVEDGLVPPPACGE